MRKNRWLYLALTLALITLVAVPIYLYNMPLGPALALEKSSSLSGKPTRVPPSAQLASLFAQQGTCGSKGVLTLLVLGLSSPDGDHTRGADAIRLVKVDFEEPSVSILAMPPNLQVSTPILDGVPEASLTETYWHARDQAKGGNVPADRKATQAVAQTLYDNFVFEPDHYLTINQPVFAECVDNVGGIDLDLPALVDASDEGFGIFPAGEQHLNGPRTLDYVRILRPNGQPPDEWGRFQRQNQVLQAILDVALLSYNWDAAPELAKDFRKLVTTDMSVNRLRDLTCILAEVGADAELTEIPQTMVETSDEVVLIPNTGATITDFIAGKMGGGH